MKGLIQSVSAYFIWGCFPLFFHLLKQVPALEILSFRIVFACLFGFILIALFGETKAFIAHFKQKNTIILTIISSSLISLNWFVFIWAVSVGQVIESSLGYFIAPLVSLLLGRVFLKEHLSRYQLVAGLLAVIAVMVELILLGNLPWVSIVLAVTFGFYGLARKQQRLESLHGLTLETFWVLPIALAVLFYISQTTDMSTTYSVKTYILLVLSGVLTAVPLLLFASSVRKLNLVVAGFLMYLNPLLQFLTAVFILGESAPTQRYITFVIVWLAMLVFIFGMVKTYNKKSPEV